MRISQYARFGLFSETLLPDEIGRELGCGADFASVKGSKIPDPPIPRTNRWEIAAKHEATPVDAQIRELVERMFPFAPRIGRLVRDGRCQAALLVVRRFGDPDGEEEDLDTIQTKFGELQKLPGQHQLLGWHLGPEVIAFLCETGAELDVDEYG